MAKLTLSAMIGGFRFVDLTTGCRATHSPKERKGLRVEPAEALDERGDLRKKYEAITDKTGTPTGEYALRSDAPVYANADDRLKSALRKCNSLLDSVCYAVGGGSRVLTEPNYGTWDEVKREIAIEVAAAREEIETMRIDSDDPNSPMINDFLRARGCKPIALRFDPLLHPEVRIADPDAQEQARLFVKATQDQVSAIIDAVQSADPDRIATVLSEAKNIEHAIADEATRVNIRQLLEAAQRAKKAAQIEREKLNAANKAEARKAERRGTDAATVRKIERDGEVITQYRSDAVMAAAAKRKAMEDISGPAAQLTQRFAMLDLDDDSEVIAPVESDRAIGLDVRDDGEIEPTNEERIAAVARSLMNRPSRRLDMDCPAESLPG